MATTRKTTTKQATGEKTTVKRASKPELKIVKEEPKQETNVFEQMASRFPIETTEVDLGDGLVVSVRNRLTLYEMMELVQRITDACIDEQRGEVHSHIMDYVAKMFITAVYCNISVPENPDAGYVAVLGENGIYRSVSKYIDPEQLNEIWHGCRMKLRAKEEMYASAAAKISIDMMQKVTEMYEMISGVTENFDSAEALKAVQNLSMLATGR